MSQIQPLVESLEALPNFLNFVIEQFLLHVSLIRPLMEESSVERICKDLEYLCRIGLQVKQDLTIYVKYNEGKISKITNMAKCSADSLL